LLYLWIAVGGALGSVSRAWVAITMARITGPEFPWGTILINVVGSFVIALFGTLTVADGRFPASATSRAFFMVGVCGGFTTFSSFSLQTLELARDGRFGQALGNIGLSVGACLFAVTCGWYCAQLLNGGRAQVHAERAASTRGVVVALLNRPDTAPAVLAAAGRLLALAGGGGRVEALAIHTPLPVPWLPSEEVLTAERRIELQAEREAWSNRLKTIRAGWSAAAEARGLLAEWIDIEGDPGSIVAEHGRRAEAMVVASRVDEGGERERQGLHAALFDSLRPVLVVPPGEPRSFGKIVAIAWKDDERAAKAVRAAMPILRQAERVYVLHAVRDGGGAPEVPAILREQSISATPRIFPAKAGSVGMQVLAEAHQVQADLLVMGAYAHGEWREALLGGVTRCMLENADLPVLMQH